MFLLLLIFTIISPISGCYEDPTTCDERVFDRESFVCVCDAEYCDVVGDVKVPQEGSYKRIISSRDKYRFKIIENKVQKAPAGKVFLTVNYNKEYQEITGFGGAFSDSAGIAVTSLSEGAQDKFMRSYFSKEGIEYNLCRVPIGGTDFSTHPYSYDEVQGDMSLTHFALTKEDLLYKIPFIQRAKELSPKGDIRLFGSPWSPPPWMKENGKHNGKGGLLRIMWQPWANYLIRFLDEYEKKNISFWGISTINEPTAGFEDWPWNACAWSAEDMRDWIKNTFGPTLEAAGKTDINVIVFEQTRDLLPSYPAKILEDEEANKYVDVVGVHWYTDSKKSPEVLDELHNQFEDKFILYTEACEGFESEKKDRVQLGSWERAQNYSSSIIQSINHYSTGWVDWNMALDLKGGPSWAGNVVDSPILVDEKNDQFYKQPMFYAMGHFSKFVAAGSRRLRTRVNNENEAIVKNVEAVAFRNSHQHTIIYVILNKSDANQGISIETSDRKYINIMMDPKSLETILIKETS